MKSKKEMVGKNGPLGFVFFIAWFGALVYFINQADGFWQVVLAFLQACVWPALLLYRVLQVLGV